MRTRIALVAIIPVALITAAPLAQAASAQPARVSIRSSHHASATPPARRADRLTSYVRPPRPHTTSAVTTAITLPDQRLATALFTGQHVGTKEVASIVPPPPPPPPVPAGPVDTVTATQRAEWDRVAMCEEGGDWQSDGSRFSGGLGITRSNWDIYGGLQYAPEAAEASPDEQIMVAERIQSYPPDQDGCSSW